MKRLLLILALAVGAVSAQAQIIVVKAGADGKVFEPSPLTIASGVFSTPSIASPVLSGTATGTYALAGTPTLTAPTINAGVVNQAITDYSADGAVVLTSGVAMLSKTSAGAYTLAAPGAAGKRITLTTTTDFAHVVTFTGGTLWDGTATANTTWTSAAVQGSSLTIVSVSATKWNVESFNLGTIAP